MYLVKENDKLYEGIKVKEDDYKVFQSDYLQYIKQEYDTKHEVILVQDKTVECGVKNSTVKPAVILNFADAESTGGIYRDCGLDAQEEDICAKTNLYQTQIQELCQNEYYSINQAMSNETKMNGVIYTRNYVFRDEKFKILEEYKRIDIISCAAVAVLRCRQGQTKEEIYQANEIKIQNIFTAISIATEPDQAVILGAFGCGVFRNDPVEIAETFMKNLKYLRNKKVIFAIPNKNGTNYKAFEQVLSKAK